ncbi:hypothetical protein HanPSC8_Chr06g0263911 [Helianthus annuus]|nr:hypothetical protein HanPSC8_Chr06g0263911 [Helianthus annuus]
MRGNNPELYMEKLRVKYKDLSKKVQQRKRQKTNGNRNENNNMSGGVGRGKRLNRAQKERMRLLTTTTFDGGKGEDNKTLGQSISSSIGLTHFWFEFDSWA